MRFVFLIIAVFFFSSCTDQDFNSDSFVPDVVSKTLSVDNPLRREPLIPSTTAAIGCSWKDFWTKEPGTGFLYMDCYQQPIVPYEDHNAIYMKTHSGSILFMEFIPYAGGTPMEEMALFMKKNAISLDECTIKRRPDEFGTARGVVRLIIEPKEQKLLPPGEVPCGGFSLWERQEKYFEFQDGKPTYALIHKDITSNWFDEDTLIIE